MHACGGNVPIRASGWPADGWSSWCTSSVVEYKAPSCSSPRVEVFDILAQLLPECPAGQVMPGHPWTTRIQRLRSSCSSFDKYTSNGPWLLIERYIKSKSCCKVFTSFTQPTSIYSLSLPTILLPISSIQVFVVRQYEVLPRCRCSLRGRLCCKRLPGSSAYPPERVLHCHLSPQHFSDPSSCPSGQRRQVLPRR